MVLMPPSERLETIEVGKLGNVGEHFRSWVAQHLHGWGVTLQSGCLPASVSFISQ
jgi:hypothetical protein